MKNRGLFLNVSILMIIFIIQGCAANKSKENIPDPSSDPKLIELNKVNTSLIRLGYLSSETPVVDSVTKYDKNAVGQDGMEYKLRYILLKTEEEAKTIIDQLNRGGNFQELANNNSIDVGVNKSGGDLGWLNAKQMIAPVLAAVTSLENGKYTTSPIKTNFGWHVILREDARKYNEVDSVKPLLPAIAKVSDVDAVGIRVAIRDFQKAHGLQVTGEVTPELLAALNEAENSDRGEDNNHHTNSLSIDATLPASKGGAERKAVCRTFIGKRINGSFEQAGGCTSQALKDDVVKHYQQIKQVKEKLMPKEYKIVESSLGGGIGCGAMMLPILYV